MVTETNRNNPSTTNVGTIAMLMRIKISQWGASKKDKQESREVCEKNKAEKGAANVFVQLVPKGDLKSIQNAAFKAKKVWHRYTLPWIDDGVGILAAKCYERCEKEMNQAIEYFNQTVDDFLIRYPEIVKNSPPHLGELLRNNPLPNIEELKAKFRIEVSYQPVPQASDFRVSLNDNAINEIRRNITNSVNNATQFAITSLYDELFRLVSKIKDTTAVKDKIFRDSLIGNLKEFCEMIPDLNIMKDERLNTLCRECKQQLTSIDPQDLRDNNRIRKQTSEKADKIIENIRKIDLDMK